MKIAESRVMSSKAADLLEQPRGAQAARAGRARRGNACATFEHLEGDWGVWTRILFVMWNGAFTEEPLNAIMSAVADANKDGVVDTEELVRHISKAVPEITGDAQHPSLQKDNPLQIFSLPVPE